MRFEDLEVWKRSARLSVDIYRCMQAVKDFGFRDQLTRAGLSVPSHIAEGIERESNREFVNFLSYAKGSCGELRTQIYIGLEIGYIERETGKHVGGGFSKSQRGRSGITSARKPERILGLFGHGRAVAWKKVWLNMDSGLLNNVLPWQGMIFTLNLL